MHQKEESIVLQSVAPFSGFCCIQFKGASVVLVESKCRMRCRPGTLCDVYMFFGALSEEI
jgi:hypothetical protein